MSRIGFVSYEIHPTTWGGAGVLLRHVAESLLDDGHEVVFLLDVPEPYFRRFVDRDRLELPNADRCRAYQVDALCSDLVVREEEVVNPFLWKALRFDHALGVVGAREALDYVEFVEYCGIGYAALAAKLFGRRHAGSVLGVRAHNSVELIDLHEATKPLDVDRYGLYGLERAALRLAESVLVPSKEYAEAYYLDRYGLDPAALVVSRPPMPEFGRRVRVEGAPEDEVVYYGRIFEFKGVALFVRAALMLLAEKPDLGLRFVLIGPDSRVAANGGSYVAALKKWIPAEHARHFEFTGHLDHRAVRRRLSRTLFAVFPNSFESFCYALHEMYDAGVPVVLADIPAFRNDFRHEENAYFFDGTTAGLASAMERMYTDASLRRRLERPRAVADRRAGKFYAQPRALLPLDRTRSETPQLTIAIVAPAEAEPSWEQRTLRAVLETARSEDRIVLVRDATGSTDAGPSFPWLGRLRRMEGVDGAPLSPRVESTTDALWILLAGDEPDAKYATSCRLALARRNLAFAGCWSRSSEGRLRALDPALALEAYPWLHGARPTRALLRTDPGILLADLFDPRLGRLGEVGYLWDATERWDPGCVLAEVHLVESPLEPEEPGPEAMAFLLTSRATPQRADRLAQLAAVLLERGPGRAAERSPPPGLDAEHARRVAWEMVNGSTLARMAEKKLRNKIRRWSRRLTPRWRR